MQVKSPLKDGAATSLSLGAAVQGAQSPFSLGGTLPGGDRSLGVSCGFRLDVQRGKVQRGRVAGLFPEHSFDFEISGGPAKVRTSPQHGRAYALENLSIGSNYLGVSVNTVAVLVVS